MKCRSCGEEVILMPSAAVRARHYGHTPEFYTSLFPKHAACILRERTESITRLLEQRREQI
jgi:hypothetical protein